MLLEAEGDNPDWCIIDLDPKEAPFSDVVKAPGLGSNARIKRAISIALSALALRRRLRVG